jgi:hypothetical protein
LWIEAESLLRSTDSWALERAVKTTQALLAIALIASAILAAWIVATDGWLRAVAPTHEYGLLIFAVLDILLSLIVFLAPGIADVGAFAAATFQVAAMLGDAFAFAPAGTMQAAFRAYLLSDVGFVALLAIQLALAIITAIGVVLLHASRRRVHAIQATRFRLT